MGLKNLTIMILGQNHVRQDWFFDFGSESFESFWSSLKAEMETLGILLEIRMNHETVININSYNDLLNCVKISSMQDGHVNQCVGHIIGVSKNLDIMEDIRTAVRRIAFAPETIAPDAAFRKVCHNCGCGC